MKSEKLRELWKQEEDLAHIKGWDFSHIDGRFDEENDLPWDYRKIIDNYRSVNSKLLDYDTGGGEFLLSLNHPYANTSATEGYAPNVKLCMKRLLPLGINFKQCENPSKIPFDDNSFDLIINRHGAFDPNELHRLLSKNGIFITDQVGCNNDRDLVKMVLPDTPTPFPHLNLQEQKINFIRSGFEIIMSDEAYKPITFYDIGAFVWFAHIIEWEFPNFSVYRCFNELLEMQKIVERDGKIEGTIHRYLIVARK